MRHGYIKTAAATPYITVADCRANGEEIIRSVKWKRNILRLWSSRSFASQGIPARICFCSDAFWTVHGKL